MPSRIDGFTCVKTLGKGLTAIVKLAESEKGGEQVALKIMDKSNSNIDENFWKTLHSEIITYNNLSHPFMVKLLDFREDAVWHKSDGTQK